MVDRQRSHWMRLITVVAIGALLAGCTSGGGSGNETGGTPGGGVAGGGGQGEEVEFVYLAHTDIDTLDVQDARAFTTGMLLGMHVFDTLVQLDAEEGFVPRLATSWEFADDGRVLRFHLRDDVKFHDGTPMTAEHVARSFQRYLEQPDLAQARKIQPVHTIRAVDDYTVEFVADEPIGEFLLGNCLVHAACGAVVNMDALEAGTPTIGTGPFKFVEWIEDDRIVMEANRDYWLREPAIDRLVIEIVPEGSTRVFRVQTGDAHLAINAPSAEYPRLKDDPNVTAVVTPSSSLRYVGMMVDREPFNDVRVRQAMNYAVDKQAIIESVLHGVGNPLQSYVGDAMYHNTPVGNYPYDPERARQLLEEAGWGDGFEVTLLADNRTEYAEIATAIAGYLEAVGVTVNIEVREFSVFLEEVSIPVEDRAVDFDMWLASYGAADPDALRLLLHCGEEPPGRNTGYYCNPEADALLEAGQGLWDPDERTQVYAELFEVLMEDAPYIPLDDLAQLYLWRPDVQDVVIYGANQRYVDLRWVTVGD